MTIGIPYATQRVAVLDGKTVVYAKCPECGVEILCADRKDFESFSNRPYAEHWDREHAVERKEPAAR